MAERSFSQSYEIRINRLLFMIYIVVVIVGSLLFLYTTLATKEVTMLRFIVYEVIVFTMSICIGLYRLFVKDNPLEKYFIVFAFGIATLAYTWASGSSISFLFTFGFLCFSAAYLRPKTAIIGTVSGVLILLIQFKLAPAIIAQGNILRILALIFFLYAVVSGLLIFVCYTARELITSMTAKEKELTRKDELNSKALAVIGGSLSHLVQIEQGIRDNSSSLSNNAKDVAASVEEISSTMEELTVTSTSIAKNSKKSADDLEKTMDQTMTGMDYMEKSSDSFTHLVESAAKIKSSITQIFDITEQTALLALNAAIESARAGESGKGFAVVAKEIQKLSDRSAKAAKEIEGIITEANTLIEETYEKSKETVFIFSGINQNIAGISELGQMISQSTTEQSRGADDVVNSLDDIAKNAEKTVEISDSIERNAQMLKDISKELTALFKDVREGNQ